MPFPLHDLLATGSALTDRALERLLPGPETPPHSIHRAMRHSTFAGGKRIRPILCLEAARMVAGNGTLPEGTADLAAALEMLHTYSLIHDDLPALDNDDLRRGQPTCHKLFGEATAILAGDALQTLAFQTIAALRCPPQTTVAILREVTAAIATGVGRINDIDSGLPPGMIGGQVMDLEAEHQTATASLVEAIHRAKTGALITVSIVAGGLFGSPPFQGEMGTGGGAGKVGRDRVEAARRHFTEIQTLAEQHTIAAADTLTRLRTFGENAGLAFQIVDDVLDLTQSSAELGKTAGKDTASTKATWPAVHGVDQSLRDAGQLIADAFDALASFGPAADPLKALAHFLTTRRS